jgi:hypothetical protein
MSYNPDLPPGYDAWKLAYPPEWDNELEEHYGPTQCDKCRHTWDACGETECEECGSQDLTSLDDY